jgi:hypothetical protein
VVECRSSKHRVLNSNPKAAKKKEEKEKEEEEEELFALPLAA